MAVIVATKGNHHGFEDRFAAEFHETLEIPAIVQWYYSLNKLEMSIGLKEDIVTPNPLEFVEISRHFKKEIDELIKEVAD